MFEFGNQFPLDETANASKAEETFIKTIYSLEEGGATALGPALTTSIGIAAKAKGSEVLLLTDGLANIGLGSLEGVVEVPPEFENMGKIGSERGVSVNVISIRGDDVRMDALGKVCELTGGKVDIVDPTSLQTRLESLSSPIVGTEIAVSLRASKGVTLNDPSTGQTGSSVITKISAAKKETDSFYSFEVASDHAKPCIIQMVLEIHVRGCVF